MDNLLGLEVTFICAQAQTGTDEDLETYKATHPHEFGDKFEGDIERGSDTKSAINDPADHWPDAQVPYVIDAASNFTEEEIGMIKGAIKDFKKNTCVRWVKRKHWHSSFVNIFRGGGCYSWVGVNSKDNVPQDLSLATGCFRHYIIVHEMLHAIGFFHEQSRADRDDHLTIVWENIREGMEYNFRKVPREFLALMDTPYNYQSVMHYGPLAFSTNGNATIVPKVEGVTLGNGEGFSPLDIERVNKLYRCNGGKQEKCEDRHARCGDWKKQGGCKADHPGVLRHCPKSCGRC